MLDDATERVVEYSSRLQPSINLHAAVIAFMFSCSGTDVLPAERWRLMYKKIMDSSNLFHI